MIDIDAYLEKIGRFVGDPGGKMIRQQFKDHRGSSELAMLASPSKDEYNQLSRAVAIMTASEKESAKDLTDGQVAKIAEDAYVDCGLFAIFVNGYALECKE